MNYLSLFWLRFARASVIIYHRSLYPEWFISDLSSLVPLIIAMAQAVEIEPYDEIVEAAHYNTPVGSRSSSPHDSPGKGSPPLSQSNGPMQTNSLLECPPRPALRSYQLADPEPWRDTATDLLIVCVVHDLQVTLTSIDV